MLRYSGLLIATLPFLCGPNCNASSPVAQQIQDVLDRTEVCNGCPTTTVSFRAKTPSNSSKGQRVLIMDHGMDLAANTRYSSRVLNQFIVNHDGTLRLYDRKIEIPDAAREILIDILNNTYPDTPASELNVVSREFEQKLGRSMSERHGHYGFHAKAIFGTLADLNPQAEFVLLYLEEEHPAEHFCQSVLEGNISDGYQSYIHKLTQSILDTANQYELDFINLSSGVTLDDLKALFAESNCSSRSAPDSQFYPILELWRDSFYRPLGTLTNTVLVQAAPFSRKRVNQNNRSFMTDCADFKHRLRVNLYGALNTSYNLNGTKQNTAACTDIYFNNGLDEVDYFAAGEFPIRWTGDGVGSGPAPFHASSYAPPIAISYLIYLRRTLKEKLGRDPNVDELLQHAKEGQQPLLKDPMRHGEFERYR